MFLLKKRKCPYRIALRLRNNKVNEHEKVVLLYEHIWPMHNTVPELGQSVTHRSTFTEGVVYLHVECIQKLISQPHGMSMATNDATIPKVGSYNPNMRRVTTCMGHNKRRKKEIFLKFKSIEVGILKFHFKVK